MLLVAVSYMHIATLINISANRFDGLVGGARSQMCWFRRLWQIDFLGENSCLTPFLARGMIMMMQIMRQALAGE